MSDVAEVKEALESGVKLSGDSPHLLTVFGEMQTHGKKGHWLVFPRSQGLKVLDAARRWVRMVSEGERVWVCLRESRIDPQQICRDDGCGWNLLTPASDREEGR